MRAYDVIGRMAKGDFLNKLKITIMEILSAAAPAREPSIILRYDAHTNQKDPGKQGSSFFMHTPHPFKQA